MSQPFAVQCASAPLRIREWNACNIARLLSRKASVLVLFRWAGSIPSFLACSKTIFWISRSTRVFPLKTREAVATLTFAADAISRSPTLLFLEDDFFMRLEPNPGAIVDQVWSSLNPIEVRERLTAFSRVVINRPTGKDKP